MATQISDIGIDVNDVRISIVPNSFEGDEGLGEQDVLVQSAGGGIVTQVFSNNVETNLGAFKFDMRATVANLELIRGWKANRNQNVVAAMATTPDGNFKRTYQNAVIVNNYKIPVSADGVVSLEWKADAPTT